MARLPVPSLLLLLLLLLPVAASGGEGSGPEMDCMFDHSVNSDGAIELPVFHRNHPCLRSLVRPPGGATGEMNLMEASIDVIEDRSINDFLFLMPIKLGTPPTMNLVAIDTGSTLSWVQCQPCTIECHKQPVEAGQIYDPSQSTTFQRLPCSSRDCLQIKDSLKLGSANCMEKENSCLYRVSYGVNSVYSVGKVVMDKLLLGNNDTTVVSDFTLGCSLDVKYKANEAGIFGFGRSEFSFEQVAPLLSYKAFGYCLPSEETKKGYMYLGDFPRQGVDGNSPLFPSMSRPTYSIMMKSLVANGQSMVNSNSEMVLDSGSRLTYLSAGTFANLADALTQAMRPLGYFRANPRETRYICFQSEHDWAAWNGTHTPFSDWPSLPTVEISFVGTASLKLPPTNVFYNDPAEGLCTNFAQDTSGMLRSQVLGNRVTRSFETIFDIQGKQFGFRYGACY